MDTARRTLSMIWLLLLLELCCAFGDNTDYGSRSHRRKQNNVKVTPMVINTWPFENAAAQAYLLLQEGRTAIDAVVAGCSVCEDEQCDGTVGWGGSPDETGETTLDALVIDGTTHNVGAVGALRGIKSAISVARHVMDHTTHTLLVGSQATEFAIEMGFQMENLTSEGSQNMHDNWLAANCQPNHRENVEPNPKTSCGPYTPLSPTSNLKNSFFHENYDKSTNLKSKYQSMKFNSGSPINRYNHDTIGMIALDENGDLACGTSTNGEKYKIPGRVGDSPIPGSGCYVDTEIGGAAATGDGDIMMRFMPALLTVQMMGTGIAPKEAAARALQRIVRFHMDFSGAIVATTANGTYGAACHALSTFQYCVAGTDSEEVVMHNITCT